MSTFLARYPYLANSLLGAGIISTGDLLAQAIERRRAARPDDKNTLTDHLFATPQHADFRRTAIMASYSACFFSPLCVLFYRHLERVKFTGGLYSRGVKRGALFNVSLSVPFNVVFFSYVTTAEMMLNEGKRPFGGTAETRAGGGRGYSGKLWDAEVLRRWWEERRATGDGDSSKIQTGTAQIHAAAKDRAEIVTPQTAADRAPADRAAADRARIGARIRRKFREDLLRTIGLSAVVWVPAHSIAFIWVPVHLRTIFASGVSVIWSTFLSLIQHREVAGEDAGEQGFVKKVTRKLSKMMSRRSFGLPDVDANYSPSSDSSLGRNRRTGSSSKESEFSEEDRGPG